jgi:glutathione S-transferase
LARLYGEVLEPAFMSKLMNTAVPRGTAGWVPAQEAMDFVINTLVSNRYLVGGKFSAADVLYGSTFARFSTSPLLPQTRVIDDYVKRCTERPAYARPGKGRWLT